MNRSAKQSLGTSCSLLERVKANAPEAWQKLTQLYGPLVYHWCRRAGLRAEDAADVVQDVFRTLVVHIHTFRRDHAGQSFRAWLSTVTRSRINDHFQKSKGLPPAVGGSVAAQELAEITRPEDETKTNVNPNEGVSGVLRRALDLVRGDFEESTWHALRMTALESRTSAEAASELGLSPNAVRKAKARVLQRLREELGDLIDA